MSDLEQLPVRSPARRQLVRFIFWMWIAYLAGVGAITAAFWWIGERHPAVLVALYLPRMVFAAPLAILLPAAVVLRLWNVLAVLGSMSLLLAVPLLGLRIAPGARPMVSAPTVRVLSYNVWLGAFAPEPLGSEVLSARPDIVLFQASSRKADVIFSGPEFANWSRYSYARLAIVSRYALKGCEPSAEELATDSGPAFVRCRVATPLGNIEVFNVHLVSPRLAFDALRRAVKGHGGLSAAWADLERNAAVRERQAAGLATAARQSTDPVLIVGDTNLPGLSPLLRKHFSRYADAFDAVGCGLGYTFPAPRSGHAAAWMRIDRAFAGPELRFHRADVLASAASDHFPLLVDVARASD